MASLKTQIPLRIGRDWYGNELNFLSIPFNLQEDLSFQTSPHDVTHSTPTPHMLGSTHARVVRCSMLVTSQGRSPLDPCTLHSPSPRRPPFLNQCSSYSWLVGDHTPFCALPRVVNLWLLAKVHACRCSGAHPPHPPLVILGRIPSPLAFVLEQRTTFPSWSPSP